MRSETIFKRKNLPKTFEKHSLTIVRIRKWIASSPKGFILSTMFTRIDNILIKMRQKVGSYLTCINLKAKKLQLKQIL
jgi:hypothetical protein